MFGAPAAFVHVLNNHISFHNPGGNPALVNAQGAAVVQLKGDVLATAALEFLKVETAVSRFEPPGGTGGDPFWRCLPCARLKNTHLQDGARRRSPAPACARHGERPALLSCEHAFVCAAGTRVPDVPFIFTMDAMNGANRFSSAGQATTEIKRDTHTFIGKTANAVLAAHKNGTLLKKGSTGATHAAAAEAPPPQCATSLTCNRVTAHPSRADMDYTGIVGAACVHGTPGENMIIIMKTPEMHAYYDFLVSAGMEARPETCAIYLDLACRYTSSFEAMMKELAEAGLTLREATKLLLPWMHGFDHDMACQLKHSGLFSVRCRRCATASSALHLHRVHTRD